MQGLVATLRDRFDVVIYDSPPVLSVTDAVVLAEQVDGVVLVVRSGTSRREQVAAAVEAFRRARSTLLGTVLAGERRRSRHLEYGADRSLDRAELAPMSGDRDREQPSVSA